MLLVLVLKQIRNALEVFCESSNKKKNKRTKQKPARWSFTCGMVGDRISFSAMVMAACNTQPLMLIQLIQLSSHAIV